MSVIAVYKEDGENTFRLILLTEAQEYLYLSKGDGTAIYVPSADVDVVDGHIETSDFDSPSTATSGNGECLNNKAFICSQLWEIRAEDINCNEDNGVGVKGINFSGVYSLLFNANCRSAAHLDENGVVTLAGKSGSDLELYCNNWLDEHPDIGSDEGFRLDAKLTWKDEVCDPLLFEVQFEAEMDFYADDSYDAVVSDDHLFQVGEDTIYVE